MNNNTKREKFYPFIIGKRIYLREVRTTDVNENYYTWMNDPIITQYLESRFYPNSIEALQEYVRKQNKNKNNLFLGIITKQEDQHIGNIKLGPINWFHRIADIGIIIGEQNCWGKGYATEAIELMITHAFNTLNLHKITAGCYTSNPASAKAFQKIGFEIEGIRKQHNFCNGKYIDAIMLGLINPKHKND